MPWWKDKCYQCYSFHLSVVNVMPDGYNMDRHSHTKAATRLHFVLDCYMGLIGGESDYVCSRKGVYWSRWAGCPEQSSFQAAYYKIHSPRADGKNLADEDVTPHRPRRLSYIIHHLSLPRLSSEPKSEWKVYNQVYGVKLTAFLNWEKITNAKHPWHPWNLSRSGTHCAWHRRWMWWLLEYTG